MRVEQPAIDQRRQIGFDDAIIAVCNRLEKTFEKKEQGIKPCSKIVSTLNFLENLDLILIVEATLLVRVRAPPETWTTKLEPLGQPEP
jgi:hypothetical protein